MIDGIFRIYLYSYMKFLKFYGLFFIILLFINNHFFGNFTFCFLNSHFNVNFLLRAYIYTRECDVKIPKFKIIFLSHAMT